MVMSPTKSALCAAGRTEEKDNGTQVSGLYRIAYNDLQQGSIPWRPIGSSIPMCMTGKIETEKLLREMHSEAEKMRIGFILEKAKVEQLIAALNAIIAKLETEREHPSQ